MAALHTRLKVTFPFSVIFLLMLRIERALSRGVDVVVGTPGRIIDHFNRKTLSFANLRFEFITYRNEIIHVA